MSKRKFYKNPVKDIFFPTLEQKFVFLFRTGRKKRVGGSLPFGWERKVLEDGKIVYVDHENCRTTFADPRLAFAVETGLEKEAFRQRFDAR